MHELSMAESILSTVIENSEKNHAKKVIEVVIEVGKMAMLNSEQVIFLLETLSEDTIANDANFIVKEIPIEIECSECDFNGKLDSTDIDPYTPLPVCQKCGSLKVLVKGGKDIIVKNIVIDQ
ncbi:MAG: hydrogenase maturation nickel metallochaperone HypA [Methanobrevibacter sp.]|jgi:hydrogenase nickel incorporation protein HypA/HybF|nr:hydrogenase maturation nickel metallochaperone HypA [Candidatus Methanovirga australis]